MLAKLKKLPSEFCLLMLSGFIIFFVILFYSGISDAAQKRSRSKPLPPLAVVISPVQQGLNPSDIQPGETIEFLVTARSMINADRMVITIELKGGAELVSGETSWSGPAAKDQEKSLGLTVKTPSKGTGRIEAAVSIPSSDGARFSTKTEYVLGTKEKTKPEEQHPVRKDSKGRDVIEYR